MAAVTAGADAILAAALDAAPEPADVAWNAVQGTLAGDILHPREIAEGDPGAVSAIAESVAASDRAAAASQEAAALAEGTETALALVFSMSGARAEPGFLAGVGALCALAAETELFSRRFAPEEVESAAEAAAGADGREAAARVLFPAGPVLDAALAALRAKPAGLDAVRARLALAAERWDRIRDALDAQLMHWPRMQAMLAAAGAPVSPQAIGISPERASAAILAAPLLWPRYGILDLAWETGRLADCAAAVSAKWTEL